MSAPPVRDRLVSSAITLLRTHGADGFGMTALLEHSRVARRSMYQYFPDGKADLLREATATAGKALCAYLAALLAENSTMDALDAWVKHWEDLVAATDFAAGCPLAAASLAAPEHPAAAQEAATAFTRIAGLVADALVRDGLPADEAAVAGNVIVSGMEGAIIHARATRSTEPFDTFVAHARSVWG